MDFRCLSTRPLCALLSALLLVGCRAYIHTARYSVRPASHSQASDARPFYSSQYRSRLISGMSTSLHASTGDLSSVAALTEKLRGTCVYFVGMMGSGKSTIGENFAKRIGYRFLDTDEIAEFMVEMPIADFFKEEKGEEQFRDLEYQILMEMSQYTRVVLATGGGIVQRNDNWGLLRHGVVVYLESSPSTIMQRLKSSPGGIEKRPLLHGSDPEAKLAEILEARKEKYSLADVTVSIPPDLDVEQSTDLVVEELLAFIVANPPLWKSWKSMRDLKESEGKTIIAADGKKQKLGSVKYVSLSDIESGKVQMPNLKERGFESDMGADETAPFQ